MARLLSRQGNRVGAMLYDLDVERIIEPSIGRRHVLHLARETMRPVHGSRRGGPGTDLGGLVEAALIRIRRRSLVVLVSDFHSTPGWHDRLGVLSRRHDVIAVRVTDPTEHLLPDAGLVPITDAETGEQIIVDTTDPAFRRRFAEVAAVHERELTRAMRAAGVDMFTLSTQGDVVDTLVHMARSRRRRR